MVQISAITFPALLAALATLSVAAPTPYTSSDITAPVDVAARDVAPVEFAPEGLEARSDRYAHCPPGYDGYRWCRRGHKWDKSHDMSDYQRDYDQEYRKHNHQRYPDWHDMNGYRYKWGKKDKNSNEDWYSTSEYNQEYDYNHWDEHHSKRDLSEVEAPEFDDIVARDVDADISESSLEARTSYEPFWGWDGYQRVYNYKTCKYEKCGDYKQIYDQNYRKSQKWSYWAADGCLYEYVQKTHDYCKTNQYDQHYDSKYYSKYYY